MGYKNKAVIYQGFIDENPESEGYLEQFTNLESVIPKVFEKSKYQNQYDSIVNGKMEPPEYNKPAPSRERIRKQLIRSAKDQLFVAMDEGAGQAIADYVNMSEERAYTDALSNWQKERDNYIERTMKEWQSYAKAMKPLLDNDINVVTSKISKWLAMAELPYTLNVTFDISEDTVSLELDAGSMKESIKEYVSDRDYSDAFNDNCIKSAAHYLAAGLAGVAISIDMFHITAADKEDIVYDKIFKRDDLIKNIAG